MHSSGPASTLPMPPADAFGTGGGAAVHPGGAYRPLLPAHTRPAVVPQDQARAWLDVLGGLLIAIVIGRLVADAGSSIFQGSGWGAAIGWESVWLVSCLLLMPLLPSGVHHNITTRSTIHGLRLDWPELLLASYVLISALQYGAPHGWLAPIALALSVGFAEEFLFRVLLLGWLVTRIDSAPALLLSSLVFGLAHVQQWDLVGVMNVLPQFAGGMVLGAIYLRTSNPIGPILAHAFWDLPYFLALGSGISGGGGSGPGMPSVVSTVMWTAFAIYGLYLIRWGQPVAGREEPPCPAEPLGGSQYRAPLC